MPDPPGPRALCLLRPQKVTLETALSGGAPRVSQIRQQQQLAQEQGGAVGGGAGGYGQGRGGYGQGQGQGQQYGSGGGLGGRCADWSWGWGWRVQRGGAQFERDLA